ncbi:MAG TPA: hypothetical protein PLB39_00845 [Thermoleophilia bacterium]|mgnify:FL=1|nr:hypothetical protein [Thermoleophilia bacterium]
MRPVDLTAASRDLLAPCCAGCAWWLTRRDDTRDAGLRRAWEREAEAETGFFGRALVDGDAVIGWMHVAAARLVPRARCLPAGPPSPDAHLLTCAYFYDEEYLHGFRLLLHEVEAALKQRQVPALEAFALGRTPEGDAFRGYLRALNLFNADVLEGDGFQRVQCKGDVVRLRIDLAALVEAPRRSVAWRRVTAPAGTQPV